MYLWGSKLNHSIWSVLGQGLRMAQDMGAHRRKMYSTSSSMEGESIKRAFWYVYFSGASRTMALM